MKNPFLTAEWQKLAMINYEIDPGTLEPLVPFGTELDLFHGKCFVSLVSFMFTNTRIKGLKVPGHTDFEEVNLRFYVARESPDTGEKRRGVVFIKELVPKSAISFIANNLFGEHYDTVEMDHEWKFGQDGVDIQYQWKYGGYWNNVIIRAAKDLEAIEEGSEAEFITEHYWGYASPKDGKTYEYQVEHPRWAIHPVFDYSINIDFGDLYGKRFKDLTEKEPHSVYLAEGSEVKVGWRRKL